MVRAKFDFTEQCGEREAHRDVAKEMINPVCPPSCRLRIVNVVVRVAMFVRVQSVTVGGRVGGALQVCTLCSCFPLPLVGRPPDWYKVCTAVHHTSHESHEVAPVIRAKSFGRCKRDAGAVTAPPAAFNGCFEL